VRFLAKAEIVLPPSIIERNFWVLNFRRFWAAGTGVIMTSPPFKKCRTAKGTFHFPKIENVILRQKGEQHQAIAGQSGDPLDAVMISPLRSKVKHFNHC